MKSTLYEIISMFPYCIQYLKNGRPSAALVWATTDGILSETYDGSGVMVGQLVSGGRLHVPMQDITNVFQWWKQILNTGNGKKTVYRSDRNMEQSIQSRSGHAESWNEDGTLKDVEHVEELPPDAKRVYR